METEVAGTARTPINKTPAGKPAQHRAIDLVHLAKQTLGDRGLEQEVLRLFDQTSKTYLYRVRGARSDEELKISLHSLKGAAAGVGANRIADAARAAEIELRETGKLGDETIADIGFAVEETSVFIVSLLED